jgi:hypothetical protein
VGTHLHHREALSRAERVFVTAHPAEPAAAVALRAGEAALACYLEGAETQAAAPADADRPDAADVRALRTLFTRHLRERLPDDPAAELHAVVAAAAVAAALDLALAGWLAAGAPADGVAGCRERFRAVGPLLPALP